MRKGWRGENDLWEKREKRENEDGECVEAWRLIRSKIPRVQVRAGRESALFALLGCGCRGFEGAVC